MKIDDLFDMMNEPRTAAEMMNVFKAVLIADDISKDEKGILRIGFIFGASWATGNALENSVHASATRILELLVEWEDLFS